MTEALKHTIYIGMGYANLGWLSYRSDAADSTRGYAAVALAQWKETRCPFQWTAWWVLLALNLQDAQLASALAAAQAMLHPSQQRLPDAQSRLLEKVVQSGGQQAVTAQRYLEHVLERAKERGYL